MDLEAEVKRKGITTSLKTASWKEARPAPTLVAASKLLTWDDAAEVLAFSEGFELGVEGGVASIYYGGKY
ncbi:MAG: hypothetical protein U9R58_06105 [Chloroflexota bacterium]|nr:hypothetical protein [Chloroflexota bacterium]